MLDEHGNFGVHQTVAAVASHNDPFNFLDEADGWAERHMHKDTVAVIAVKLQSRANGNAKS